MGHFHSENKVDKQAVYLIIILYFWADQLIYIAQFAHAPHKSYS